MNLVIFDCDGVLVDTESVLVSAVLEFLHGENIPIERNDYIRQFVGLSVTSWQQQMTQLLQPLLGCSPDADYFARIFKLVGTRMKGTLSAINGAQEAIGQIEDLVCVASSSSLQGIERKLHQTDLLPLFHPHLFSSQMVTKGKPAPDLFLHAAKNLKCSPSDCIVIEDSSNGVQAAKRAGMKVIGFTAGGHCPHDHSDALQADGADISIGSYAELGDALRQLRAS